MPWFFVGLASGLPDEPGKGKRPGKDARRCSREFLRVFFPIPQHVTRGPARWTRKLL